MSNVLAQRVTSHQRSEEAVREDLKRSHHDNDNGTYVLTNFIVANILQRIYSVNHHIGHHEFTQ